MRRARLAVVLAALGAACGPPAAPRIAAPDGLVIGEGLPLLARVVRDGDPASAIAAFVSTEGVEAQTGAAPAVALAEIFARRLAGAARGARVSPQADGVRVEVLVSETTARAGAIALRDALLGAVKDEEVDGPRRRLELLARVPAPAGYEEAAWCGGDVLAGAGRLDVSTASLERVRAAAVGRGRVAFATAGAPWAAEAARAALVSGPRWPEGAALGAPARGDALRVASDVDPARTRARVIVRASPASAVRAATLLGTDGAPLSARLRAEGASMSVARVVATVHAGGAGCVAIDLEGDASATRDTRLADAIEITRDEAAFAVDEAASADLARESARAIREAGDVRDAAARAAAWALAAIPAPARSAARARPSTFVSAPAGTDAAALASRLEERLAHTGTRGALETRAAFEREQGAAWVVLASPCGTASEGAHDAGVSALFVAAAAKSSDGRDGVRVEPWYAADGVGVIAHAAREGSETDAALAKRVADVAARALLADPLGAIARARTELIALAQDAPALGALGAAVAPGHPSWLSPGGTSDSLLRAADASVLARASTLRAGPVRLAVLAGDRASADAAAAAADRWLPHVGGAARACPSPAAAPSSTPGTYGVPSSGRSEAWLALPLEAVPRAAAQTIAAILDGPGGALDLALARGGLARRASARVLAGPRPVLAVHVEAPGAALDASVAQVRALLDRVRKSGPSTAELERARREIAASELASALDPRGRALRVWRGPPDPSPTDEAVRAAAATLLRDDALVIVALRPDARAVDRRTP